MPVVLELLARLDAGNPCLVARVEQIVRMPTEQNLRGDLRSLFGRQSQNLPIADITSLSKSMGSSPCGFCYGERDGRNPRRESVQLQRAVVRTLVSWLGCKKNQPVA